MTAEELSVRAEIAAAPAEVYRALTDPGLLRAWLADRIDAAVDEGRWGFGGRHVPFGDSGRQRLLAADPGAGLRFSWHLDGTDTDVTIRLADGESGGTALALTQAPVPDWGPDRASLLDFWVLAVGNLANQVEGRSLAERPDFGAADSDVAVAEVGIAAPAAEVFTSLIEPEQLNRWIASTAAVEAKVGGRYDFGWGDLHGPLEVVEHEPPQRLAYSWHDAGWPDTVVRWSLQPGPGGETLVRVRHEGFVAQRPADGYQVGWLNFLISLKRMHELGERWRPIQWQ